MLPKYPPKACLASVTLEKYTADGRDVSRLGAFPCGETVRFSATCPRALGVTAVVLRLARDGEAETDMPFVFAETCPETLTDRYELTLDTGAICGGEDCGLFYYRLLFIRHEETLFSDSRNNVDFDLTPNGGSAFRLLVHKPDFAPPVWFGEGIMYHVFVDRFRRGEGKTSRRTGERAPELNPDWEGGIPQYAPYPGAPITNHVHFGGNLWGVAEKLDYLASLGVKVLYLSPIFEAYSNHKYDTGNYLHVDGGFGGDAALDDLIEKATAHGIRIVLDGVFNHTGDDSIYFDRYGIYAKAAKAAKSAESSVGATQSPESDYRKWFCFKNYPDEYDSWWGIDIMPKLNHAHLPCRRYFTGENGVCARYVKKGIAGWRLDVADELCDEFLDELRDSVKAVSEGEAVIIGEVWENAADKIAYGRRRRYFQGAQLDSVMNYPVRSGILSFVGGGSADHLYDVLTELYGSYPRAVSDALMNLVGTHDTERILTVLGSAPEDFDRSAEILSTATVSPVRYATAVRRLKLASLIQYTVFGIPSLYYGDEVGMQGYRDPFCRRPFPWHELEEPARADMLAHYRGLGDLRRSPAFHGGDFRILDHGAHHLVYERVAVGGGERVVIAVHRGESPTDAVTLPAAVLGDVRTVSLACGEVTFSEGSVTLSGDSGCVLR